MKRAICTSVLTVVAVLLIITGILVTMFFTGLVNSFIFKELELREGSEAFKLWQKPPLEPLMRVYFFNLTNPQEFLLGSKPVLQEVGPYTYREVMEKVNIAWNTNGTVSFQPMKKYYFVRSLSRGDQTDIINTINIPLITGATQVKNGGRLVSLAYSSMLTVLKEQVISVKTVDELLWGYESQLLKLGKDVLPPENVLPFSKFGLFIGKNGTSDGTLTIVATRDSQLKYGTITNWNGRDKMKYWNNEKCNQLRGSDGTMYPPGVSENSTLEIFNPDLCRVLPIVFQKKVSHSGIEGFRFVPHSRVFDSPLDYEENACYCRPGSSCVPRGLFNISVCKFGSPIAISWPHFLDADPKLLENVGGLNPDRSKHELYIDIQPTLGLPLSAKVRVQINIMLSPVADIKQVSGLQEMVFPIFWFETGIDELPDNMISRLKLATEMPETARAGISYSLFGLGGLLLLCVAIILCRRMKSNQESQRTANNSLEMDKRTANSNGNR